MSVDESDEEDALSNDYTHYLDSICFVISMFWIEREKYINTQYAETGCMLCVISHIIEDVSKNLNIKIIFR